MKIIAVFQDAIIVVLQFVLIGFILGGCSAPRQLYYFSRYTNRDIASQKIDVVINSADSINSMISNPIQKEDLLASTSKNAVISFQKKVTSEIHSKGELTKKQGSHKNEKIGLIKTWKALRNVKSTNSPEGRKKKNAFYIGFTFGWLLIFNKYLPIAVGAVLLIVLGTLFVLHIKESKLKKARKLKVNSGEIEQNLNSGQEIESEQELKIQKKKRKLIMLALILTGMVLSYTITYLIVSVYSWLSAFGGLFTT